jgi:hypothetical protein
MPTKFRQHHRNADDHHALVIKHAKPVRHIKAIKSVRDPAHHTVKIEPVDSTQDP